MRKFVTASFVALFTVIAYAQVPAGASIPNGYRACIQTIDQWSGKGFLILERIFDVPQVATFERVNEDELAGTVESILNPTATIKDYRVRIRTAPDSLITLNLKSLTLGESTVAVGRKMRIVLEAQ